ncbi:MAG: hypothetical protein K1X67_03910 [Fimbriimonadaceae bacterium]|nr:hypothetical protein [Fimbriimonadaceae bacterium]
MNVMTLAVTLLSPLGFQVTLPEGWKVLKTEGVFQVLQRPNQTENELYILGGTVEMEAKVSWEERLQREDDAFMKGLGPWKREGEIKSFASPGGQGMLGTFSGEAADEQFEGQLWSLVSSKRRFGILAVYPKSLSTKIYSDLYQIATSFKPEPDRPQAGLEGDAKLWASRLAGVKLVRVSTSDNGSLNGSGGTSIDRSLSLFADGTFQYSSRSAAFIGAGDFSGISESSDEATGKWSVQMVGEAAMLVLQPAGRPAESLELRQVGEFVKLGGQAFRVIR